VESHFNNATDLPAPADIHIDGHSRSTNNAVVSHAPVAQRKVNSVPCPVKPDQMNAVQGAPTLRIKEDMYMVSKAEHSGSENNAKGQKGVTQEEVGSGKNKDPNNFANNPERAAAAGRKGGHQSHKGD
jgi:general stress protein YciG